MSELETLEAGGEGAGPPPSLGAGGAVLRDPLPDPAAPSGGGGGSPTPRGFFSGRPERAAPRTSPPSSAGGRGHAHRAHRSRRDDRRVPARRADRGGRPAVDGKDRAVPQHR